MRTLITALTCLALSGCGTLLGRADDPTPSGLIGHDYYKGVKADVMLLSFDLYPGYGGYASLFCWLSVVCPVATVVSMPVDATVDTVLLPWDAYSASHF